MARRKKQSLDLVSYHEGLSTNQVKVILREFGLGKSFDKFNEWMYGQTRPIIPRYSADGKIVKVSGVYEYDLFRWIAYKTRLRPLLFD